MEEENATLTNMREGRLGVGADTQLRWAQQGFEDTKTDLDSSIAKIEWLDRKINELPELAKRLSDITAGMLSKELEEASVFLMKQIERDLEHAWAVLVRNVPSLENRLKEFQTNIEKMTNL